MTLKQKVQPILNCLTHIANGRDGVDLDIRWPVEDRFEATFEDIGVKLYGTESSGGDVFIMFYDDDRGRRITSTLGVPQDVRNFTFAFMTGVYFNA